MLEEVGKVEMKKWLTDNRLNIFGGGIRRSDTEKCLKKILSHAKS